MTETTESKKNLHHVRLIGARGATRATPKKRANTFSKSRDTREDRGTRQAKNSRPSQTNSHPR